MSRAVFIAGAHTDVGKTHVACALIEAARAQGCTVEALKPVVSGFDPGDWSHSDPGRLLTALGRPQSDAELDAISPWRFWAPLAPPTAARREDRALGLEEIIAWCRARMAETRADLLVLEGAGGLMSPIAEGATGLEMMGALDLPAVLVGGSYLGGISHTLTAIETARAHRVRVSAVVISQSGEAAAPDFEETVADVRRHAGAVPVVAAPRDILAAWPQALHTLLRSPPA